MQQLFSAVLAASIFCLTGLAHAADPDFRDITAHSGSERKAAEYRFVALAEDADLPSLMSRWAAMEGRTVVWAVKQDYPKFDAQALNRRAHLDSATSLVDAFSRVSAVVARELPEAPLLAACYWEQGKVALSVYTEGQPKCGVPTN